MLSLMMICLEALEFGNNIRRYLFDNDDDDDAGETFRPRKRAILMGAQVSDDDVPVDRKSSRSLESNQVHLGTSKNLSVMVHAPSASPPLPNRFVIHETTKNTGTRTLDHNA